jgi:hypothetical protein
VVENAEPRTTQRIAIADLLLDPENPRLPTEMQGSEKTQREIALYINKHYDPLRIAMSVAEHRFFESEPLIAVAQGDKYKVIEGNRRLTAIMGLADARLREEFGKENSGWKSLAADRAPSDVPVLVVNDPSDVAPLLGFRHISGIEPWDPYAQARYIAQLVDRDGHSLDDVAELVGRTRTEVASKYRDYDVLNQADGLGINTRRARQAFGIFNNAMGRRAIRAFISAPDPRSVDPSRYPIPDDSKDKLALLLDFIFGATGGQGRVISDSRQLGQLAQVLSEPSGRALAVLTRTRDLQEATEAVSDPSEQFARAIARARSELVKALAVSPEFLSHESATSLSRITEIALSLLERDRAPES